MIALLFSLSFAAELRKPMTCIKQTHKEKVCVLMEPLFDENDKVKKCIFDQPFLKPIGVEVRDGKVEGMWECKYCFRCED